MYKKYAIEFIGSIFFIFVVIAVAQPIPIGLALILCIMIGGKVSGGHFNPAVTISMVLNNKLPLREAPWYILSQILGGVVALSLKNALF